MRRPLRAAACLAALALFACDDGGADGAPTSDASPADAALTDAAPADALTADAGSADAAPTPLQAATAALSPQRMKVDVDFLAADEQGGRIGGSPGHARARDYMVQQAMAAGLQPFGDDGTFLHTFPGRIREGRYMRNEAGEVVPNEIEDAFNVVGLVPAADDARADDYIVYLAHYDHLGVDSDGDVFNGAFDNAGGAALGLEMARVMLEHDARPACNVVFLFSDGEETGLAGAEAWIADPPIPKASILVGISGDPIGRGLLPDYAPLLMVGIERSPSLRAVWAQADALPADGPVYMHRAMIPVFASDQDEFHAQGIPGVWFITPGMSFYHTVDDAADTIDYRVMLDAGRYMLRVLHLIADADQRFEYLGEPEMDVSHAVDVKAILDGAAASEVLTPNQRAQLAGFIADIQEVIDAGNFDPLGNAATWFGTAVAVVAFNLPRIHPGPVPPPFPGE